jgi:hypothetical protein
MGGFTSANGVVVPEDIILPLIIVIALITPTTECIPWCATLYYICI